MVGMDIVYILVKIFSCHSVGNSWPCSAVFKCVAILLFSKLF